MTREIDRSLDCFADEVAIDFPSVGQIVEKARDAFLGEGAERDDTHTADVSLSTREAWRGTVVPIELPLRGTCGVCGGRGEVWTEPCADCGGSGAALMRHAVRLSVPAGVAHGARLRFRIRPPQSAPVRLELRVVLKDVRV